LTVTVFMAESSIPLSRELLEPNPLMRLDGGINAAGIQEIRQRTAANLADRKQVPEFLRALPRCRRTTAA